MYAQSCVPELEEAGLNLELYNDVKDVHNLNLDDYTDGIVIQIDSLSKLKISPGTKIVTIVDECESLLKYFKPSLPSYNQLTNLKRKFNYSIFIAVLYVFDKV